jgi:hypothetical protein
LHVPASVSHEALQQSLPAPQADPERLQQRLAPPSAELQLPLQQLPPSPHPVALTLQQDPLSAQLWPGAQAFAQLTELPQLLVAVPLQRPLHAVPSSTQQPFGPASPAPQTPPSAAHVSLHWTDTAQLFCTSPHEAPASSHTTVTSSGVQQPASTHTPAAGHVPQETTCPQFKTVVSQTPSQGAGFGVQQVPESASHS